MQAERFSGFGQQGHARNTRIGVSPRQNKIAYVGQHSCHGARFDGARRTRVRLGSAQRDVTAELLERAFTFALTARLKQHSGIHVDVRSNAWGLLEGKFGGMTVRGYKWRTPLELTAEQLMVDVGEMVLDYQKLMWQQTVALKNVPQGFVSFTLSSQDLANFMAHPIMVGAAARAIKGKAFIFDRNTAAVRLDPATGRGIITYQGIWAGDGQRYSIIMTTPPAPAKPAAPAAARPATGRPAGPSAASTAISAASNTLEQLTVIARRVLPPGGGIAARSSTGSFASAGSLDEPIGVPAVATGTTAAAAATAAMAAAAAVAAATGSAAAAAAAPSVRVSTLTLEAPMAAGGLAAGRPSLANAGSSLDEAAAVEAVDESEEVVGEGLRRFFSALTLNLQGIEMRQPVLLVQLPGAGVGAAATGTALAPTRAVAAATPAGSSPLPPSSSGPLPALLTITMKVAMLQLPPLNMKF